MVGIVNYGAGNIFSVTASLDRLQIPYGMINNADDFDQFDRYIIPGVGHAGAAMKKLEETGMVPIIRGLRKPVLGICVGMQLLSDYSEEGDSSLTSIIPLKTRCFTGKISLKVPHTGWNTIRFEKKDPLFNEIDDDSYFYFVHSYFIEYNKQVTLAAAEYGLQFSAIVKRDNFYGVQFHPEKSGAAGEQLLKNFSLIQS